ncbi:MAG TPA: hypothetical protein VG672_12280 [Bryobacteraceae bacterium]|nr:hypothetical protein [Bryobacteraceae bacterium]
MDTRNKILTREDAIELAQRLRREGTPLGVVTGHFDVLLAGLTRELECLRKKSGCGKLLAVVSSPAEPILSERARAEMAAALRVIDYVVTAAPGKREALLAALQIENVADFEPADERRSWQLVEHVHRRQAG